MKTNTLYLMCVGACFVAAAADVRVTDSVNAGARPARLPQGAEAFEVVLRHQRPQRRGGDARA